MQDNKNNTDKVTVKIFNNEYPLKGVKNPEHIIQVAEDIDKRMRDFAEGTPYLAPDRIAVLVALELGDQLATVQKDYDELWKMVTEYKDEDK